MKPQTPLIAVLALILALGATTAAQAQYPSGAPPAVASKDSPTAKRQKLLLRGIKLTTQQQAKVDSLQARFDEQLPAMLPGAPPDSALMERMRMVFEKHDTELRVALTPDQHKVFDKNREELRRQPVG